MIKQILRVFLVLIISVLAFIRPASAQTVSNEGLEFWSVFPTHVPNMPTQLANISIFITGKQNSSGVVSVNGFSQRFNVTANTVTEVQVPRSNAYINETEAGRSLTNRAIHILVDAGKQPVVVYAHIFAGLRSAASLILPVKALGQKYYSMNYTQTSIQNAGKSFITIVASEANTKVFLKQGNTNLVAGGITLAKVGDVYEYLSDTDLTGVSVTVDSLTSGCKRFAMFSGSSGAFINDLSCIPTSQDPLYQQDYPIESWGRTYGFIPFSMKAPNSNVASERTLGDYLRVVAAYDGTQVQINGTTVATINAGQFYSSFQPINAPSAITSNNPISVAQYALTASCSDRSGGGSLGDPDMVILNPIEYSIKNITVYSSTREAITEQYLNVVIKTSAAASFLINGRAPATQFLPLTALPGYSYLILNLNGYATNNFNLTADDGFNAIAYGFGQVESYSYSAGTNLATTVNANAVDPVTNLPITYACVYDSYNLRVTLNVPSKHIVWAIDGKTVAEQTNPVGRDTLVNNQPLYIYEIPKPKIFNTAGTYAVNVVADLPPSTGGCNLGFQTFNFPFTVNNAPKTAFLAPASICLGETVSFTDKSLDSGKVIKSWIWNFGDGSTSTLQNPTHTFTKVGLDTVSLTSISETGCQSTTLKTIRINNVPDAVFTYTNSVFKDFAVMINDASTIAAGKIVKWIWTFGDGKTQTRTSGASFEHIYPAAGTYQVNLTVVSDFGCQDTVTHTVIAKPGRKPDFTLPQTCSNDLQSQFTDLTVDSVSAGVTLTYLWDFGDANATASNPNTSTLQNPTHFFGKAQVYQVTETVIASDSSSGSVIKSFQVNGSIPKAGFDIAGNGTYCSSEPVTFTNRASVDVGSITKIEWYFDYGNQPNTVFTVLNPTPGATYTHQYDAFTAPANKTITIRMLAYSGITCVDMIDKTIILQANPKVAFTALGSICQEVAPFQITQAKEITGAIGTSVFSGDGVSSTGLFDPSSVKIGAHQIKYVFTTTAGCSDSLTQNIVVTASPTVDAGNTVRVHIGDKAQLSPKVTGNISSYLWMPATGLSNPRIANPIVTPTGDVTYRLLVTSADSCAASDTVTVLILKIPVIPNTFTPNNDGVNDVWNIQNLDRYPDCIMDIYNRYGIRMFHSTGYGTAWDGTYNGQQVPVGTYYYVLNLRDGEKNYGGYVTVIR